MQVGVRMDVLLHLELAVRPSAHLGRTGLDRIHVFLYAELSSKAHTSQAMQIDEF